MLSTQYLSQQLHHSDHLSYLKRLMHRFTVDAVRTELYLRFMIKVSIRTSTGDMNLCSSIENCWLQQTIMPTYSYRASIAMDNATTIFCRAKCDVRSQTYEHHSLEEIGADRCSQAARETCMSLRNTTNGGCASKECGHPKYLYGA